MRAIGAHVYNVVNGNAPSDAATNGRSVAEKLGAQPLRLLLSYHYYKDVDIDALLTGCFDGVPLDIFADSGAFSAYTLGQPLDVTAYIVWAKQWQHRFTAIAGPDVIGDAKATADGTYRMMEALPDATVLPTFHVGDDWSWLDHWTSRCDYLALGGMVPYARAAPLLRRWVVTAFSRIPATVRVHGFGLTTWSLLRAFPWYSVDSSSWTGVFRFGVLALFDDARGVWVCIDMHKPREALRHARLLASYGLRPTDVRSKGYDRDRFCGASVFAWRRAEAWLNARRAARVYVSAGSLPAGEHGNGHDVAVANGLRAYGVLGAGLSGNTTAAAIGRGVRSYLSIGSADIEGAPNRPAGCVRTLR
jgi:hypothetical protein